MRLLSTCPRFFPLFPRNFGGSFNTSYHINYCPENPGSASSLGVWHEIRSSVRGDTCLQKTDFLIPISADEKGATSVLEYWPIIRPLSSSFTLPGDSFGLLYVYIPTSLSFRSQNAKICWLSFWPGFVTSAARNWPTFLFLFLTVSLWRPVNSNTEG